MSGLIDVLALQGVALPSTNISSAATVFYEEKSKRSTLSISIDDATFNTTVYVAPFLGSATKSVSASQAKRLPGVVAGETITVFLEAYIDSISGSRSCGVDIDFYKEDGTHVGSTESEDIVTAETWEQKKLTITVPSLATRVNVYLRAECGSGETMQAWFAKLKIIR